MRLGRGMWFALTIAVSEAGCATVPRASLKPEAAALPPTLDEVLAKIDRDVAAEVKAKRWPDLAIGIVYDGKLSWWRGYGEVDPVSHAPVTDETCFRYGSITKTVTGLALLQLRDAGKLSLDDPLEKFIPEVKGVVYPTAERPPIRLRDLVTHASGLPRAPAGLDYAKRTPSEADLLVVLPGLKLDGTPGVHDEYSNYASCLEGVVIHRASEMPYEDWIRTRIAEPLGLGFRWTEESVPSGRLAMGHTLGPKEKGNPIIEVPHSWVMGACNSCGGLYGSLDDLAKYAAFELSGWPPRTAPENPVASRATLRESQQWHSREYGVNWRVEQDPKLGKVVSHGGLVAGYTAQIQMVPDRGFAVVGLLGFDSGWEDLDHLVKVSLADLGTVFPRLAPELRLQLGRLLPLLDPGSGDVPEGLFTNDFTDLLKMFDLMRQHGGNCRVVDVLSAGTYWAEINLECERGALHLKVSVEASPPHSIDGFWFWFPR